MNWHCLDKDEVLRVLDSSLDGLTSDEVTGRLNKYGFNQLIERKKKSRWFLFISQFKDFMIIILIAAAVISGVIGDITDTIIILVIVLLNAVIGFVQEYRGEKAMEALKKLGTPQSVAIRNGKTTNIDSTLLVPGDIILVEAGVIVPADMRLMETHLLQVDEAMLTGESSASNKSSKTLHEKDSPLGDRVNMLYKGTRVTKGRGKGAVVSTGMNTEIGHVARMLQQDEAVTPLQKRMTDFGRKLSYVILVICLILFAVGLLRGEAPMSMLLLAISLAVAAIPEALPALITIALARGARRLAKKKALIRKLPAVEALGSVTFICTDKTGTLTENKMKVVKLVSYPVAFDANKYNHLSLIEHAMAVNQDVKETADENLLGDPTEIAIVEYIATKYGGQTVRHLQKSWPRVFEIPFDSDRKCMTTVHQLEKGFIAIAKGAVESITAMLEDKQKNRKILDETQELAADGIRVLGYAYRYIDSMPEPSDYDTIETNMSFAGFVGLTDPPREEIKAAIKDCKMAGIQPVMITGDHRETAVAIAHEIKLLDENGLVITGKELNALSDQELDERVERIKVYARVSPQQKLNIVKSLQRRHHFVAMTGDGINDAPSLKASNVGVSMGITGTDVSKEAAHMILLDDNFATIVRAIREGRRIYDNIRKFIKYIMTCNGAEIWTIFLAPLIGLPIPLLPIHILWINLVTDGLPGLSLTTEKAEKNIMRRPPRPAGESLFAQGTAYHVIWVGLLMSFVTLGIQAWAIHSQNAHWQTMVFTVLSLAQLGHVFAIRSNTEFIYKVGLFSNPSLSITLIFTFLLQLAIIYVPFANEVFKTQPLTPVELLICILVSAIVFHAVELEKWIKKLRGDLP